MGNKGIIYITVFIMAASSLACTSQLTNTVPSKGVDTTSSKTRKLSSNHNIPPFSDSKYISTPITSKPLCLQYAEVVCLHKQACSVWSFVDSKTCVASTRRNCELDKNLPGSSLNTTFFKKCIQALVGVPCQSPFPAACKIQEGRLIGGASCIRDAQCQSLQCDRSQEKACGTCRKKQIGRIGEDCTNTSIVCDKGLICNSKQKLCLPAKKKGDTCYASESCQSKLYCDFKKGLQEGTCKAFKRRHQRCTHEKECGIFRTGLTCSKKGFCVPIRLRDVGKSCRVSIVSCKRGLYCKVQGLGDKGRCAVKARLGQACSRNVPCLTGYCSKGYCRTLDPLNCSSSLSAFLP